MNSSLGRSSRFSGRTSLVYSSSKCFHGGHLSFITLPFLAHDPKAIEIVQIILESILLRREKNMRDTDGNRIVDLPSKEVRYLASTQLHDLISSSQVVVENLEFTPLEKKIYDSIYASAKRNFEQLNAQGLVSKNYTHILAMLMKYYKCSKTPKHLLTQRDVGSGVRSCIPSLYCRRATIVIPLKPRKKMSIR